MFVVLGVLEDHRADATAALVPEERAVFLLKTPGADLLSHAEALEDRKTVGKQRLSDVKARELFSFEDDHASSGAGEHRGDGRPSRSAADDRRIVRFTHRDRHSSARAGSARRSPDAVCRIAGFSLIVRV